MPVLPLVGSTIVEPGFRRPRRSASSSMATAMRSLTLPPGFIDSIFATTLAPPGLGRRFNRTIGVRPTSSTTEPAIFGAGVICGTSDRITQYQYVNYAHYVKWAQPGSHEATCGDNFFSF